MFNISLSSLETTKNLAFSNTGPAWRIVKEGISFEGICKNRNCPAYNQRVIDGKGFGIFDIGRISSYCPMENCKSLIQVENCGFYQAKWQFSGITLNGEHKIGEGDALFGNYTTFEERDIIQWKALRICVSPCLIRFIFRRN